MVAQERWGSVPVAMTVVVVVRARVCGRAAAQGAGPVGEQVAWGGGALLAVV